MELDLLEAVELISRGKVIAVSTETVYGLAASLFKEEAVDNIFRLKGRPPSNPLIIHVAKPEDIIPFVEHLDEDFLKLANAFWPGPLTFVLPIIEEKIPAPIRANLKTAAFRVPNHPKALKLLTLTGPLVMPSANLSGKPSATCREHVEADFGIDFPVLDGGECAKGLESTIIYRDFLDKEKRLKIIRQGVLTEDDFFKVLGYRPEIVQSKKSQENPICPGQLFRHYAPKARLGLTKRVPEGFKGVIVGYEGRVYSEGSTIYSLGSVSEPESVSHNLYSILRRLDDDGVIEALVDIDIPDKGLLATILERLRKASQKP